MFLLRPSEFPQAFITTTTHRDKKDVPQKHEDDEINPRYFASGVLRMPHYVLPAVQRYHLKRLLRPEGVPDIGCERSGEGLGRGGYFQ